MFKKIFLLLILVVITCCACGKRQEKYVSTLDVIKNRGYIIVGVKTDAYPFGFINEKNEYDGLDVALTKIIAKHIFEKDGKVKFIPVTASDRMMKLYSENVDMIVATMSVTPTREQILDFSNSYYTAGQAMLVKKGSNISSLKDLSGKKAIIVFGSTGERSLRTTIPNVGIIGYQNYKDAYAALKKGRGDAIVSDDTILLGLALKDNSVELLPKRFSKEPYAIAFRKGPESRSLIRVVNRVIDAETRKGNIKKLQEKYGITQY